MSDCKDNQDVGLEAATIQRVRNSSLVKWSGADNVTGLKSETEATDSVLRSGRGAFPAPAKRRRKPAVEGWEVRMLARVTRDGGETRPPNAQGFLSKANLLRVSRDLSPGRKA